MKVLFAVNNEEVSEAIVKKYQKKYKEIISYKNVYYFNAILKEIQKDKTYDRIVISEDLEQFTNTSYEQMDKFIFEKLDGISDEASNSNGRDIPIILICTERRNKSEEILVKLFGIGIYNAIIGNDRSIDEVCRLIYKPRLKKEAKTYYQIDSENVSYKSENENDVSEVEIQNILAHFKRLGNNEMAYIDSYNRIAEQYNDNQLKVISRGLPLRVRAVLEEKSPKYQQVMAFNKAVTDNLRKKKGKQDEGLSEKLLVNPKRNNTIESPIIVPASMKSASNAQKLTKNVKKQQEIEEKTEEVEQQIQISELNENVIDDIDVNNSIDMSNIETEEKTKRGRGRPRKNPLPAEEIEEKPKRGRGRPRKTPLPIEETETEDTAILPDVEEEEEAVILPQIGKIEPEEDVMLPQAEEIEPEEDVMLPQIEEIEPEEDVMLPQIEEIEPEEDVILPQNEEIEPEEDVILPQIEEPESEEELILPTLNEVTETNEREESEDDYSILSGMEEEYKKQDDFISNKVSDINIDRTQAYQYSENSYVDLSNVLQGNKKIAAFVGTSKNGTSFIVNNLAEMLSSTGINVAILDTTRNKNSYYIYTKNEEDLRRTAMLSLPNLVKGIASGIRVNSNLAVYTSLPNEDSGIENVQLVLETLVKSHTIVLIDCDFYTPRGYFSAAQELYLVQTMDVLTIQPLTEFLKDLVAQNIIEEQKIRIIINKYVKIRGITEKEIIGGMAYYNDPAMAYQKALFDKGLVKYLTIPFEEEIYTKYLQGLINCEVSLKGYSKTFIQNLKQLSDMIYPIAVAKGNYKPPTLGKNTNGAFPSSMNNTLDQMKRNY